MTNLTTALNRIWYKLVYLKGLPPVTIYCKAWMVEASPDFMA